MFDEEIIVTFKSPDTLDYAIKQHLETFERVTPKEVCEQEFQHLKNKKEERVRLSLCKWLKYGEVVRIKFNLTKGTAEVLKNEAIFS